MNESILKMPKKVPVSSLVQLYELGSVNSSILHVNKMSKTKVQ